MKTMTRPHVLSASTLTGDKVKNPAGEELGTLKELMIDLDSGRIAYAVLSFGGVLGMGDKLFAIPWEGFSVDTDNKCLILNVDKKLLKNAEGFDKDNWPDFADPTWHESTHEYYGFTPAWSSRV